MAQDRGQWASRLGFVLAAAGSAVGLGNLWKFPYITWSNNGGAFVLVYLACVAIIGMPIMVSEILIGRKTQKSPVGAMAEAIFSLEPDELVWQGPFESPYGAHLVLLTRKVAGRLPPLSEIEASASVALSAGTARGGSSAHIESEISGRM